MKRILLSIATLAFVFGIVSETQAHGYKSYRRSHCYTPRSYCYTPRYHCEPCYPVYRSSRCYDPCYADDCYDRCYVRYVPRYVCR